MPLRVLHLASANRWTGAAAPAFAEVEALREAGIEAHYAYVGGYKLQQKIGHLPFAHAIIEKAQNPMAFVRTCGAIRHLIDVHGFDILHAHLTYDHWLARAAGRRRGVKIARTFHSERVLRRDPLTRSLIAHSDALFIINETFATAAAIAACRPIFTPPPVDRRQFTPDGPDVRAKYGIAGDEKVVMVIGKVSKGRGFEAALETFAELRRRVSSARLLIVGHGEHRGALEAYAQDLQIADRVVWAGYHEDDLADHYRAADALLFTAPGSDAGHRAILEAMACGVPPAAYPLPGVAALLGDLAPMLVPATGTPAHLAAVVEALLGGDQVRERVIARSADFGYEPAARRLMSAYPKPT